MNDSARKIGFDAHTVQRDVPRRRRADLPAQLPPPSPEGCSCEELDAAERDMQAALDSFPALVPSGFHIEPRPFHLPRSIEWFGPYDAGVSLDSAVFAFWQARMALRTEESLAALIACRRWLRFYAVKRKTLDTALTSVALRNVVSFGIGEVAHGVIIAALDLEGFHVVQARDECGNLAAHACSNARLLATAYARALGDGR